MKPGIHLSKVWFDDDVVELEVGVSDGTSFFSNRVYVGHGHLAEIASALDEFKHHIHGGLVELRLGEFGCDYANGGSTRGCGGPQVGSTSHANRNPGSSR